MAYTLVTQSFGIANANNTVSITEVSTGLPAIILASATGGVVNDRGLTTTNSAGNISVYLDTARTWSYTLADEQHDGPVGVLTPKQINAGATSVVASTPAGLVDSNGALVLGAMTPAQAAAVPALVSGAGIYADTTALQAALPATSNTGRTASVGTSAPYTQYFCNGSAWVAVAGGSASAFTDLTDKTTADIPGTNTPTANALALKAPLASPSLTGTPTAPTATAGTNTTQLATTAFVFAAVAAGSGAAFGPYATIAAAVVAKPAASNPGRAYYIGSAAPYTNYVSNGTSLVPLPSNVSALTTISASGTSVSTAAGDQNTLDVTLTNNPTLAFTGVPAGAWSCRLISRQDGTGGRQWSWPANTQWDGGSPPTQSAIASAVDVYEFLTVDQGAHWLARRTIANPAVQVLLDTVARADSSSAVGTCDTGQTWSALTGTWGISSNKIYRVGTGATDSVLSINVGAAWSRYICTVGTTAEYPGLAFDITDSSNFYTVLCASAADVVYPQALQIYKCVAGSYTQIAVSANNVFTSGTNVQLEIRRNSVSRLIQVLLSGATVASVTDSSLATTNKVGMRFQTGLATNAARWSAISVY